MYIIILDLILDARIVEKFASIAEIQFLKVGTLFVSKSVLAL